MVQLIQDFESEKSAFAAVSIITPNYNVEKVKLQTIKTPRWIHFGGGNLYRAFHTAVADELLNIQVAETGIILIETYDEEIIEKVYTPFQNRNLQVVMNADGTLEKKLLAGTVLAYTTVGKDAEQLTEISEYFTSEHLQVVTCCITEKGYNLWDNDGDFTPIVQHDIESGPTAVLNHAMAQITRFLVKRYLDGGAMPLALVSTDNFSQNGKHFQKSILAIAGEWVQKGFVDKGFIEYLTDDKKISFPWSMIDRITPNPSKEVATVLRRSGFEDADLITTKKGTNLAAFANAEQTNYLVIEDNFPNGRPEFAKAGVFLTDRNTVEKVDEMKVTTCLNPLHTSLAIFGCLLGYDSIASEMSDANLVALIKQIGYVEGLPVVANPGIIDPKEFIDEVVKNRLPNPYIPDTPQRIATDTSQKLGIRFGVTIKKYAQSTELDIQNLTCISLTIAGWCRYLLGIDDEGKPFTLSPDPLLEQLQEQMKTITFGENDNVKEALKPILTNARIFDVNLYEVGLATKIIEMFKELNQGVGAIKKTIEKYVK